MAVHVEDDNSELEIDIVYENEIIKKIDGDSFSKVNYQKLSPRMKRKYTRLEKRFEGVDGAKSKYKEPEALDGYALYDVVQTPYNLDNLAELFDSSAVHNAAVSARVMNTVGLGYKFEETEKSKRRLEKAQGNSARVDRVRQNLRDARSDISRKFEAFNKEETFVETLIKIWLDYLTTGNGYLEIGRNRNGEIGYLGHIPSVNVRVRRDRDGFVQIASGGKISAVFFRNFQDSETKDPINDDPNPNEIIHFQNYSPTNAFYGVPPAVSAAAAIVGDKFAKEYNIDYFENKAIPRYAIIIKGAKLSNASKQHLVNYFRKEVKGRNHGTLIVPLPASLGGETEIRFEKLEAGVQDSSFDKYRKSNRDEILVANRVPPPKVGIYDNANLAVSRDADKTFKTQVINPDHSLIEKKIGRLVEEFTDLVQLKFNKIDLVDEDIQSRIYDRYLRTEVISPNEVRSTLGMPEREDGDEILPFPTKIKKEQNESRGAPFGNDNNASDSPRKPYVDTAQGGTDPRSAGDQSERGQNQDTGGEK